MSDTTDTTDTTDSRLLDTAELRRLHTSARPMGQQPALDGIRALSVTIVILYHAGFTWMHGGFFGVEVFFVVSGFLITALLVDERVANGRVSLRGFWARRARRLLPALFVMLLAVSLWTVLVATEHITQLRTDLLPAIFYASNWAQIFGDVPYFSPAVPLLRHLWSLAVEEQWYLLWPLAFVGLQAVLRGRARWIAAVLTLVAAGVMVWSAWLAASSEALLSFAGQRVDRFNFLYLNTFTRSSGLLLGAAAALVWRPWARDVAGGRAAAVRWAGDGIGVAAMAGIVVIAVTRSEGILADPSLYRLWLPVVTLLSLVVVAAAVSPGARLTRAVFGWRPVVLVGQRSYGLYLWHWPIFVFLDVRSQHWRVLPALALTVLVSEACYRWVERPVRSGAVARWWRSAAASDERLRRNRIALAAGSTVVLVAFAVGVRLVKADPVDVAQGEIDAVFDAGAALEAAAPSTTLTSVTTLAGTATVASTGPSASTVPASTTSTSTTLPTLPRRTVIVGDSTAHSLAINAPNGLDAYLDLSDGSVSGCGVQADGRVRSARTGFNRSFDDCEGWEQRWAKAAKEHRAELAVVAIGAWEVFDVEVDGRLIPFGTPEADARITAGLQRGIDALRYVGTHAALIEVPCMRPQDVEGAGVPALPERGDDARVAHLNDLLRQVAAANPESVTFVAGPTAWCTDPVIAASLAYRWDGVHVYDEGAKLEFEAITSPLLQIPL
jgi:peptidoglycan/LPS O-acetylase OafA/YrhL